MNLLKSLFLSSYLTAAIAGLVVAVIRLVDDGADSPWLGTAIACAAPAGFFIQIMLMPRARTSPNLLWVIAAGVVGTVLSAVQAVALLTLPVLISAVVGIAGSLAYVYWYSRFGAPQNDALQAGRMLPALTLIEHGQPHSGDALTATPALWIFYRGNWCPLCMAQIREVAAQYRELARRGVAVHLVSPQPEANTVALAQRFDVPMRFFADPGNAAARTLGIVVEDGLPTGFQALGYDSDVPRPAVFISAAGGRILHVDLTDNYRLRPEPARYLAVLDRHAIV